MIKKIGILLLIIYISFSQDTGKFENYSNPFYTKIMEQSNSYYDQLKEEDKTFKMNFDGKKIPQSLEEFTIIDVADPISQGNTGTCWCFQLLLSMKVKLKELLEKISIYQNYILYISNILKIRGFIQSRGKTHLGEGSETNGTKNDGIIWNSSL